MAAPPLAEGLLRVTATFYHAEPASDTHDPVFTTADAVTAWKTGKRRMMQAIAEGDVERAQFEAERYRKQVLTLLRGGALTAASWERCRSVASEGRPQETGAQEPQRTSVRKDSEPSPRARR